MSTKHIIPTQNNNRLENAKLVRQSNASIKKDNDINNNRAKKDNNKKALKIEKYINDLKSKSPYDYLK